MHCINYVSCLSTNVVNTFRYLIGAGSLGPGGWLQEAYIQYVLHRSYVHCIRDFTVWGEYKAHVCGALLQSGPKQDISHSPETCACSVCTGLSVEGEEVHAKRMCLGLGINCQGQNRYSSKNNDSKMI